MTTHKNSEIKRQEKYLKRLPDDYQFPLFNTMQALCAHAIPADQPEQFFEILRRFICK